MGAILPWSLLELPAASGELSASDQSYLVALNLLEEFSKPLSLSFRLLGNILADELTLAVLYGLVPIAVPIPVFLLGHVLPHRLLPHHILPLRRVLVINEVSTLK